MVCIFIRQKINLTKEKPQLFKILQYNLTYHYNMLLLLIQELDVFDDGPPLYCQSKYHNVEKLDGFINKFTNKLRYTHPTRYPTSSKKYNGYKATLSALPDIRF